MGDTYSNILFHIIFSTKRRRPLVTLEIKPRLYDYLGGIVKSHGGVLYEIGGMEDHMHLLLRWNTEAVKDLTREMKSDSTKWVKKTFVGQTDFYWQSGGGIFSVSQSQAGRVARYIQNQENHHRKQSFEDEYIGFLKKNGIEYDERYLFD